MQYGLVLLEEKEQLEIRCEELETLYETTKNDLEITQSALEKFQSSQQVKSSIHMKKNIKNTLVGHLSLKQIKGYYRAYSL